MGTPRGSRDAEPMAWPDLKRATFVSSGVRCRGPGKTLDRRGYKDGQTYGCRTWPEPGRGWMHAETIGAGSMGHDVVIQKLAAYETTKCWGWHVRTNQYVEYILICSDKSICRVHIDTSTTKVLHKSGIPNFRWWDRLIVRNDTPQGHLRHTDSLRSRKNTQNTQKVKVQRIFTPKSAKFSAILGCVWLLSAP